MCLEGLLSAGRRVHYLFTTDSPFGEDHEHVPVVHD